MERNGLKYVEAPTKSEAYLSCEPLFAAGRIEILDHEQQRREMVTLERRLRPGGRTAVDHPRSLHDDYANVLALVAAELAGGRERVPFGLLFCGPSSAEEEAEMDAEIERLEKELGLSA